MKSLYIHVPFCQKRCHYCSFYSTTCGKRERDLYVQALLREMAERRTDDVITTIYFGGGTPSQLDEEELTAIFAAIHQHFVVAPDAEITFECNPDDVVPRRELLQNTPANFNTSSAPLPSLLAALSVNRVSMGVQSFDDAMLQRINRRHNAAQALDAILAFHRAGIHNISIDLIYGLPGQTLDGFKSDVATATQLARETLALEGTSHPLITHLSSYCLSIEEGTHLYNMRAQGLIADADEDTVLAMYDSLVDSLSSAGFEHYEISNFALPGFHSRHNSNYWRTVPYIGLGPGAHSYDGRATRRCNLPDLAAYCAAATPYEEERLTPDELYDELIMTRLRTRDGLPLALLQPDRRTYLLRQARRYIDSGHLSINPQASTLRLTRKGIAISDTIFSDLMCDM